MLKDTAIFAKAKPCHAQQQPSCPMHPPTELPHAAIRHFGRRMAAVTIRLI
jgi:hypothetical protein